MKFDVGDYDFCVDGIVKVEELVGVLIDVLVNNVGIMCDGMFYKMILE